MKQFFTLGLALCMATAFVVGCETKKKEGEVKTETTTTTPEGTTTETHVESVETTK